MNAVASRREVPQALLKSISESADKWARECGFEGPLDVSTPTQLFYPVRGYGFLVTIREREGRGRLATAHFTAEGKPSMWTRDGMLGG